jgi:hypothetical protein
MIDNPTTRDRRRVAEQTCSLSMSEQNDLWSRYSNEKDDAAAAVMRIICDLARAKGTRGSMRALSLGCGTEPLSPILEAAFRDGLYLVDNDRQSLLLLAERIKRQQLRHVSAVCADYFDALRNARQAGSFREANLSGWRMNLITLHHSLYYSPAWAWRDLMHSLVEEILHADQPAAIHAVLMAHESDDPQTTTWLYNTFTDLNFGPFKNDQDLERLADTLKASLPPDEVQVAVTSSRIEFCPQSFEQLMAAMWMVLLHPHVHEYSVHQAREVTEHLYRHFWKERKPLVQIQKHLTIYRNVSSLSVPADVDGAHETAESLAL